MANAYVFDRFSNGFVDILAAEMTRENQNWFQGTADAVRKILTHLRVHKHKYVLILSGDHLYQMDYGGMIEHHMESEADVTVGTIPVVRKDCSGFGIMKVNEAQDISSFIEKPDPAVLDDWKSPVSDDLKEEGREYLASMGIYVFNREKLIELLHKYPQYDDFGKEIIPTAVNGPEKVTSYPFKGYWTDIGSISSFFEANLRLTTFLPAFNLYDNEEPLYTRARMLAPSKIFGTRLSFSFLSAGCILHADTVDRSIIGIRSRIGKRTVVKTAIIMGMDYYQALQEIGDTEERLLGIGEDCYLENVIVDKNVKIHNRVYIQGSPELEDTETDTYVVREGIVIVKKDAVIPEGTIIKA